MANKFLKIAIYIQVAIAIIQCHSKVFAEDIIDDEDPDSWVREMCNKPIETDESNGRVTGKYQSLQLSIIGVTFYQYMISSILIDNLKYF